MAIKYLFKTDNMTIPTKVKAKLEPIPIFTWIIKIINQSDNEFHLEGCHKLVELFRNKFAKRAIMKSEIEQMAEILEVHISLAKESIKLK